MNQATAGRLEIEYFGRGEILPGAEEDWDGVIKGTVEAVMQPFAYVMHLFPQASLLYGMSGGLTVVQQLMWYQVGGGKELANRMLEPVDIVYVARGYGRPGEIFGHFKKELVTLDDVEGIKMRTAGEGGEVLKLIGMDPVWLPYPEVYEAMQRGVLDACETGSPALNWTLGYQEVADYLYLSPSRQPVDSGSLIVNGKVWRETPDDIKVALAAIAEEGALVQYATTIAGDTIALQQFIDYGTVVEPLPKLIEDEFLAKAIEYYDGKAAGDPFYAELVQSQRDWKKIMEQWGIQ